MSNRWLKSILTVVGAVFFSTLGIFASDALQGLESGFQNIAGVKGSGVCKGGAIPFNGPKGLICIDVYEASPGADCPFATLKNSNESEQNINSKKCFAVSERNARPWNYISLPQAQRACAATGKRLPSSEEWYRIALGTNVSSCVTNREDAALTGSTECISSLGAHDLVGNIWEWVDASVNGNNFDGRKLPDEGYVTSVDANGVAITSGETDDELYGKDYFWSKQDGVFGMLRGGFYGSRDDAGIYAVNASVLTSFATQGVGFRCVEDVL